MFTKTNYMSSTMVNDIYKKNKDNFFVNNQPKVKKHTSLNSLLTECPLIGRAQYGSSCNLIA